ncbi:MAG: bifunctional DNA-formamidopyrimidine glycosylase/DNA-(apurinic or apyrimidinic site) lyase [Robiginitomaculum sp.]|nr:bifunctional DNA-formamidopyrimidine glycosylase/DNA-(apurinic or apyrimidinic site) lyase [Robiginitomaculum sp.]
MPELPEVETVRAGLAPVFEGNQISKVFVGRPNLRFAFPDRFAERLTGAKVETLGRRAKYLLFGLSTGETLLSHLGMSGSFLALAPTETRPVNAKSKHDHVVFEMINGATVIYNDPRRFGFMDLIVTDQLEGSKFLKDLGPEPTGNSLSADDIAQKCKRRAGPIKSALLDQKMIAGLGNIYVCEALFRAKIHPTTRACDLSLAQIENLVGHIRDIIHQAILAGGSTLKDFSATDGELGYFQHQFEVYGRATSPCLATNCTGTIERIVQSGRSSFFCPVCQ